MARGKGNAIGGLVSVALIGVAGLFAYRWYQSRNVSIADAIAQGSSGLPAGLVSALNNPIPKPVLGSNSGSNPKLANGYVPFDPNDPFWDGGPPVLRRAVGG